MIRWSALLLALAPAGALAADTGSVSVRSVFEGPIPAPTKIHPTTDTAICSKQDLVEESLVVDEGTRGVRWVVAWIAGSKGGRKDRDKPVLDNFRCRYDPHVLVLYAKEKFTIRNRDRFLHTTQAKLRKKSEFNLALPVRNQAVDKSLDAPGVYSFHCDVHTWMNAWAVVLDDEIAGVSDEQGKLTLEGVPAGTHELKLWHETLGEKTVKITVKPGEAAQVEVAWKARGVRR